ncbi:integrase, catalytic region, zinc finger, CCHC-type containing protein [Tanacetum coccineum]
MKHVLNKLYLIDAFSGEFSESVPPYYQTSLSKQILDTLKELDTFILLVIDVQQRHFCDVKTSLTTTAVLSIWASHATTRYKGKEIAKPITPPSESASEEDSDPEQAQKDKDMQKNLALIAKYFKKLYKPTNNNLRTSSNTRNKNVDTTPRYKNDNQTGQFGNQRAVNVVGARETVGGPVVQQSGIQCFNCKEFGHYAKECRKPKRVKDSTYHKEKMLLCKQAEKGVQLQAEQSDWLADTDEEIDEQELEAHYSYMAKIQEVPNADSGTDAEPLEQVQYDTDDNVFANDIQHFDQSESISNTCAVETDDSNVTPDSPDMCDNDIQDDQNDVECDDERVALANLIANLKLDVDENKKIQKQLKKANATLTQELTECKSILAETSRTLGESNSIRDSCLVALQNKQTEFERYKAFNDRTVDYDKLEHKLNEALGLIAQKEIDIKEGLKVKAYEISIVKETSVANDTSGLVPQRQKASDYDNPDPAPELQNVSPSADTTVPSQQELDLLFGPLYDEFFNDGTSRVNKSSSPTDNSAPQDTHNGRPTFAIHGNVDFCTKASEQTEFIPKPSVLGKPTPFSNSPEVRSFQTKQSVNKTNVSDGSSNQVTLQNLPLNRKQAEIHSNERKPGMHRTSNVNAVCAECGKCVFNSNHDACVSRYLNDVNARTKKPKVVPISASKLKRKANKSVATPHKKTVASDNTIQKPKSYFKELYENTNKAWRWWIAKKCSSEYKWTQTTPSRPSLKWKPTGRIFSNVRLRWVPTGKLFNSCTGKVESEPTHGSNVDIPHIHACKQTLGLSAGTSFNGQKQQRIDLNADAHYNERQENLRVWLTRNSRPQVVPLAVKTATSSHSKAEDNRNGGIYKDKSIVRNSSQLGMIGVECVFGKNADKIEDNSGTIKQGVSNGRLGRNRVIPLLSDLKLIADIEVVHHGPSDAMHNPSQPFGSQAVNKSPTHYPCDSARTFRVILFSIHNDEWKSFQCHHQTALRSYALSWKPCQGDSLNLPDHRYQVYQGRLLASIQDDAKYEHVGQDTRSQGGKDDQDGRIKKI